MFSLVSTDMYTNSSKSNSYCVTKPIANTGPDQQIKYKITKNNITSQKQDMRYTNLLMRRRITTNVLLCFIFGDIIKIEYSVGIAMKNSLCVSHTFSYYHIELRLYMKQTVRLDRADWITWWCWFTSSWLYNWYRNGNNLFIIPNNKDIGSPEIGTKIVLYFERNCISSLYIFLVLSLFSSFLQSCRTFWDFIEILIILFLFLLS